MAGGYGDDRNRDRWRDEDRERSGYSRDREDERGFFERAGDHLRSFFSDDDEDRGQERDYQRDTSWNRNQEMSRRGMHGSSWDRDQNRSQRSSWDNSSSRGQRGDWSGGSSWDQNRGGFSDRDRQGGRGRRDRGGTEYEDNSSFGTMGRGGYGQPSSSWDRDQQRGYAPSGSGSSWTSPSDRDRSRMSGFGGFRDESDFRGQHRRSHPQSWSETNRGENESLGYGEFRGTLGGFGNQTFGSSEHDHYRNWRDREMSKLDRDYEDYCREREQQFNQDFDSWRRNRQSQGQMAASTSADLGSSSNAGVGTTTASVTGSAGSGSAIGSATGTGGSIQSDTSGSTETAGAGSGRSGSRSRS
jgi:hypothetical protein